MSERKAEGLLNRLALPIAVVGAGLMAGTGTYAQSTQDRTLQAIQTTADATSSAIDAKTNIGPGAAAAITQKIQTFALLHKAELGPVKLADPANDAFGATSANWMSLSGAVTKAYTSYQGAEAGPLIAEGYTGLAKDITVTLGQVYTPSQPKPFTR